MRRRVAFILLMFYVSFFMIPYAPYLQYYYHQISSKLKMQPVDENSFSQNERKTLVGDISYLSALIKRSVNNEQSKEHNAPPPAPNLDFNNIIYLGSGILTTLRKPHNCVLKFYEHPNLLIEIFYDTLTPPPRSIV
jgi:hypothetical protein